MKTFVICMFVLFFCTSSAYALSIYDGEYVTFNNNKELIQITPNGNNLESMFPGMFNWALSSTSSSTSYNIFDIVSYNPLKDQSYMIDLEYRFNGNGTGVMTYLQNPFSFEYLGGISNPRGILAYFGELEDLILPPCDMPMPIPEPATFLLLSTGIAGLFLYRRRKKAY